MAKQSQRWLLIRLFLVITVSVNSSAFCGQMAAGDINRRKLQQQWKLLSTDQLTPVQNPVQRFCTVRSRLQSKLIDYGCSRNILNRVRPSSLQISCCSSLAQTEQPDVLYKGLDIELKGHDPKVLESYKVFIGLAAKELDIDIYRLVNPAKKINRLSLLKSVHVHKKHFVQYETRTHNRTLKIRNITGSTADTFLEYLQRNLPEGVFMKITKCRLEELPDHLRPPP